eukprot:752938-Hanusia_phi.AAC.8
MQPGGPRDRGRVLPSHRLLMISPSQGAPAGAAAAPGAQCGPHWSVIPKLFSLSQVPSLGPGLRLSLASVRGKGRRGEERRGEERRGEENLEDTRQTAPAPMRL